MCGSGAGIPDELIRLSQQRIERFSSSVPLRGHCGHGEGSYCLKINTACPTQHCDILCTYSLIHFFNPDLFWTSVSEFLTLKYTSTVTSIKLTHYPRTPPTGQSG